MCKVADGIQHVAWPTLAGSWGDGDCCYVRNQGCCKGRYSEKEDKDMWDKDCHVGEDTGGDSAWISEEYIYSDKTLSSGDLRWVFPLCGNYKSWDIALFYFS